MEEVEEVEEEEVEDEVEEEDVEDEVEEVGFFPSDRAY